MAALQLYKGTYHFKADSKTRVNVVPKWRPESGEGLNLMPSVAEGVKILKVLSQEAFEFRMAKIEAHATSPKEEAHLKTQLVRILREVNVNEQGKMLIPKDLAEHAGILPDSEITMSAGDSHFEIWSRAEYERIFAVSAVPPEEDKLAIF